MTSKSHYQHPLSPTKRLVHGAVLIGWLMTSTAIAGPTGGVVTYGDAEISGDGSSNVTITQNSNNVVLNWDSFDTDIKDTVNFLQPSTSSVAVNVIANGKQTQFDGALSANGRIIIINTNGVIFGKTSSIDVSGLVATTSSLDTDMLGKNEDGFHFVSGGKNQNDGMIRNEGHITINNAGLAAFVSPNVVNNGVIEAQLGSVHLSSGDAFTIDFAGDGLINLEITGPSKQQLVQNSGQVHANGGNVYITAAASEDIIDNIINMDGIIEARSIAQYNGRIYIGGYASSVTVNGTLDASDMDLKDIENIKIDKNTAKSAFNDKISSSKADIIIEAKDIAVTGSTIVANNLFFNANDAKANGISIENSSIDIKNLDPSYIDKNNSDIYSYLHVKSASSLSFVKNNINLENESGLLLFALSPDSLSSDYDISFISYNCAYDSNCGLNLVQTNAIGIAYISDDDVVEDDNDVVIDDDNDVVVEDDNDVVVDDDNDVVVEDDNDVVVDDDNDVVVEEDNDVVIDDDNDVVVEDDNDVVVDDDNDVVVNNNTGSVAQAVISQEPSSITIIKNIGITISTFVRALFLNQSLSNFETNTVKPVALQFPQHIIDNNTAKSNLNNDAKQAQNQTSWLDMINPSAGTSDEKKKRTTL